MTQPAAAQLTRGAILAGGAASRFGGRAKGLETIGGERILDRAIRVVQDAVGELPLLVANADDAKDWIDGAVIVKDVIPNCGSLGGIYSAVSQGRDPVLIAAWDMPFLTLDLLKALIAGATGFDVFLPESNGPLGFEPLCGIYDPACAEPIKAALDDEDFRTTSFHEQVRVSTLPLSDVKTFGDPDMLFFNVNTPSDVAKAEQLWQTQSA